MRRNWRFIEKFSGRSLKHGGSLYKLHTYEKRPATPTHRSLSSRFSPLCLLSSLPFFPSFQPWSCVFLPPPNSPRFSLHLYCSSCTMEQPVLSSPITLLLASYFLLPSVLRPFIYRSNILFSVKKLAFLIYQLKIKLLFGAVSLHRCVFTLLFVNNFLPVY